MQKIRLLGLRVRALARGQTHKQTNKQTNRQTDKHTQNRPTTEDLWCFFFNSYLYLLKLVKQRQLRYYGHIKRQNSFLTHAIEGKIEGKRPRGRPRTTWMSNISKWTGKTKYNCTRMAVDRDLWSVIASRPLEKRWHSQVNQITFNTQTFWNGAA